MGRQLRREARDRAQPKINFRNLTAGLAPDEYATSRGDFRPHLAAERFPPGSP